MDTDYGANKMKFNLITLLISSAILTTTCFIRQVSDVGLTTHGRYYTTAILLISCIISMIALLRIFRLRRHRSISADDADREGSERPRQHYRIHFDRSSHPLFVERTDDCHRVIEFSCPVLNISESGISLGCKGVYTQGQPVQGEIIFSSGRTSPINGLVIREEMDRTCLRLHCTIDPSLLMAEQRDQIALEKGRCPRPSVSKTAMDKTTGSLPSHSSKGICRLKKP
jgi:hypothetical protein